MRCLANDSGIYILMLTKYLFLGLNDRVVLNTNEKNKFHICGIKHENDMQPVYLLSDFFAVVKTTINNLIICSELWKTD